ncbi:exosome complex protein Rrp42 [Candidatus Pacearchaeota archaeon]|nr:exosome complex protein Rrp42 [Candidatus Pacearchaeota archaeon]
MDLPNINKKKIIRVLKDEKRLDLRKLFEMRDIFIETGISMNAEGSARVRIGETEVIVGVKMGTQDPYTDHADEGTMITSMEFSPVAHERYESGPPKIDSIEVSRVVDRGLRESGFIDWKKLCIKEGEKVWSINIDIYCVNDSGNVLDASAIGALVALKFARFPEYDEETDTIKYGEFTDKPLPLNDFLPITMTFFKVGDALIFDPNRDEEDAAESRLTLTISSPKKDRIINSMQKGGITPLSVDEMKAIIKQSEKSFDELLPIIDKKIKEVLKGK